MTPRAVTVRVTVDAPLGTAYSTAEAKAAMYRERAAFTALTGIALNEDGIQIHEKASPRVQRDEARDTSIGG